MFSGESAAAFAFQSTRPRGARPYFCEEAGIGFEGFNPRAREGRDRGELFHELLGGVSIHAPARGATMTWRLREVVTEGVSIHAPARGATNRQSQNQCRQKFQSTRPRGARRGSAIPLARPRCFNPRAREGRDMSRQASSMI